MTKFARDIIQDAGFRSNGDHYTFPTGGHDYIRKEHIVAFHKSIKDHNGEDAAKTFVNLIGELHYRTGSLAPVTLFEAMYRVERTEKGWEYFPGIGFLMGGKSPAKDREY